MVYGVGLPAGVTAAAADWNYTSGALDIVAHEITHGVTEFTSDLIYLNESGALNESFSDIMGTAVEFFFQPAGDGCCGRTICVPRTSSAAADERHPLDGEPERIWPPGSLLDPVHRAPTTAAACTRTRASPNHVFYLAIEGGTNRVSGLGVEGVGAANRVQIETVFYRAVTQLLPANATFAMARAATIQAARDLYGVGQRRRTRDDRRPGPPLGVN